MQQSRRNIELNPLNTDRRCELVIFDCDGVLVDSVTLACDLLATMLTEQGLPTTAREARVRYKELLLADVVCIAERKLCRALPEDWLERYENRRADAFRAKLMPVQGAAETVRTLIAAGVGVCVASQGKLSKTRLSLELTGLSDLFSPDALFSAYGVPRGNRRSAVISRCRMGRSRIRGWRGTRRRHAASRWFSSWSRLASSRTLPTASST